jgi:hypothetical protein
MVQALLICDLTYTLTSLIGAAYLVGTFGPRNILLFSSFLYVMGAVTLAVATGVHNQDAVLGLIITGSFFRGLASSSGWVAQGVYFATCAERYAKATGSETSATNSRLASYFATSRMVCLGLTYLVSSMLLQFTSMTDTGLFIFFGTTTLLSSLIMYVSLPDLPPEDVKLDSSQTSHVMSERVLPVLIMTVSDLVSICISPIIITYGFTRIFVGVIVNDRVAAASFSTYIIGYLNVLYTVTGALVAIPMANYLTISAGVAVGSAAYIMLAICFCLFSYNQLGHSDNIWLLYVLYGIGRTSFESTVKAIYADLYPQKRAVAFAQLSFICGLSSTIFSFVEADMHRSALAILILVPACCMFPGYFAGLRLNGHGGGATTKHLI